MFYLSIVGSLDHASHIVAHDGLSPFFGLTSDLHDLAVSDTLFGVLHYHAASMI